MPKAPNALHSDQVSGPQAGVAKGVIGCNSRAKERGGFCGTELVRNGSDPACFGDHHFRISSIHVYPRRHRALTTHHVPASARFAHAVFAGDQADTNPLTDFPSRHAAAQSLNAANYFMPRNTWQSQTQVGTGDREHIGVRDSTCFHSNPHLTCSGLGDSTLHHSKLAGRGDLNSCVCTCLWFLRLNWVLLES